jgi:hypothetical protein
MLVHQKNVGTKCRVKKLNLENNSCKLVTIIFFRVPIKEKSKLVV